jgi:dienelactone hydrolase
MFGKGKVTADPKVAGEWAGHMRGDMAAWMARARAALDVLKKHDRTDARRIAAIGYCFGGSTVLGLAFAGTDLSAVVSFHGALSPPTPEQAKAIKARVLVCHGADDGFIPQDAIAGFRGALDKAKAPYRFVAYPGAKHGFTNPGADKYGVDGVKYDKAADDRSWKDMRGLFDEVFSVPSPKPAK